MAHGDAVGHERLFRVFESEGRMTASKPTEVWTVQGHSGDEGGWLIGGVFSTLASACDYAEAWASDKPGLAAYVYRWPLDTAYPRSDAERAEPGATHETVYKVPPGLEEAAS